MSPISLPPGVKEIGDTCGKCHINEKDNYLKSVHAHLKAEGKFQDCVSCHGNHGIQPVSLQLYQKACSSCHQPQSSEYQQGQKIWQLLKKSQDDLQQTQTIVKEAAIDGIFVDEETAALEETKTKVFEMGPMQHTLSYKNVAELSSQIDGKIQTVQTSIQQKRQSLRWRKIALVPLWIFIGVMVVALWSEYKRIKASKKSNKG